MVGPLRMDRHQVTICPKLSDLQPQNDEIFPTLRSLSIEAILIGLQTSTIELHHIPSDLIQEMIEKLLLSKQATDSDLTSILGSCPELQSLNLSNSAFQGDMLQKIGWSIFLPLFFPFHFLFSSNFSFSSLNFCCLFSLFTLPPFFHFFFL